MEHTLKRTIFISKNNDNFSKYMTKEERESSFSYPEKELHPAETVKLFENLLREGFNGFYYRSFVTHSEDIINWIGMKIDKQELNHEDFEIVILDDDGTRRISVYDAKGYLKNWTYGFFSYIDR